MAHAWKFFRAGGFDQVQLTTGADLAALTGLDQKLWVALSCPVKNLELDARTLELLDSDKDGRIRAGELLAAITWSTGLLKNVEDLAKGADRLSLSAINDASDEGKTLVSTAKMVLTSLGKSGATELSVADMGNAQKAFEQQAFNGDGVVPPETVNDEALKAVVGEVVSCVGGENDKNGKPGVSAGKVKQFFDDAAAYLAWSEKGRDAATLPLGAATADAFVAFSAVKAKADDYFARCRLAEFDARAAAAANRPEADYVAALAKDVSHSAAELAHFPMAHIAAGKPLPLSEGLNPAWSSAVAALKAKVVTPVLGERAVLTEAEWSQLREKLAPYEAWQAAKAGATVEKLGVERVKAMVASDARAKLEGLINEDLKQAPVGANITLVEKLVRIHRDLLVLANNFVSFRDFYARKGKATFQAGRLFLDTRETELCIRVEDAGKHGAMAPLSRMCLVYCDCVRQASGEKMSIVAALTAGDMDNLMPGRNGVFYDRQNRDWDATVTKIIENPISLRQAFWSPYKKVIRFVEEQIAKRAAAAETASHDRVLAHAAAVDKSVDSGKAEAPAKQFDVGVVAAIGVAVGGIAAAMGALLQAFFGLGMWMPLGVVGLMLLISGPSMAVAYLKLRQRNIGPLLDANGWAINAQAKINIPFGNSLTKEATLPPGSSRDLFDPFEEKRSPWRMWVLLAVLVALVGGWYIGKLDEYLPAPAKSTSVLGANAPAASAPVAPAEKK